MPLDYPNPILESPRILLRAWSLDDLACVAEAATDPDIPRGTTVPAVYTRPAGRAWIERQWSRQTTGQGLSLAVVEVESQRAVGLVFLGLRPIEGHCEIGYWLVPSARERGLGTEAVGLASRWVLTTTAVYRLYALVEPHNEASLGVLSKCDFASEGVLRSYLKFDDGMHDAMVLSLLEGDV